MSLLCPMYCRRCLKTTPGDACNHVDGHHFVPQPAAASSSSGPPSSDAEMEVMKRRMERHLRKLKEGMKQAAQHGKEAAKHEQRDPDSFSSGPDIYVFSDSSSAQSSPEPAQGFLLQENAIELKLHRQDVARRAAFVARKTKHHLITHCGVSEADYPAALSSLVDRRGVFYRRKEQLYKVLRWRRNKYHEQPEQLKVTRDKMEERLIQDYLNYLEDLKGRKDQ